MNDTCVHSVASSVRRERQEFPNNGFDAAARCKRAAVSARAATARRDGTLSSQKPRVCAEAPSTRMQQEFMVVARRPHSGLARWNCISAVEWEIRGDDMYARPSATRRRRVGRVRSREASRSTPAAQLAPVCIWIRSAVVVQCNTPSAQKPDICPVFLA
ncbi:hypothetical protein PHYPSEUDO_005995 [Phytophthora pseudosyringae]|uniref:Uncharacterized protein n=1 Tax=Phytophthora pseudosyringae TaxID=221518 RepID=A0A8T1VJK1_9STRA|nr:hypothetical protein PHYPSEUDO_005995 [Phytophthora pseudosyringae]